MKLNWGLGILIVLALFIAFIVNLVYKSSMVNVDLVSDNYYEREVKYQEQIDREKNSLMLKNDINIIKNHDFIEIVYPVEFDAQEISGSVQFFKPDDANLDFLLDVRASELNSQIINTRAFKQGWWDVNISWSYRGKDYFKREKILL
jgi:hypothetical protein